MEWQSNSGNRKLLKDLRCQQDRIIDNVYVFEKNLLYCDKASAIWSALVIDNQL